MSNGISAAEPTFRWDILIESSPEDTAESERPVRVGSSGGSLGPARPSLLCVDTASFCFFNFHSFYNKTPASKPPSTFHQFEDERIRELSFTGDFQNLDPEFFTADIFTGHDNDG